MSPRLTKVLSCNLIIFMIVVNLMFWNLSLNLNSLSMLSTLRGWEKFRACARDHGITRCFREGHRFNTLYPLVIYIANPGPWTEFCVYTKSHVTRKFLIWISLPVFHIQPIGHDYCFPFGVSVCIIIIIAYISEVFLEISTLTNINFLLINQ